MLVKKDNSAKDVGHTGPDAERAASLVRLLATSTPPDHRTSGADAGKIKLGSPFIGPIGPGEIASTLGELAGMLMTRPDILMDEGLRLIAELGDAEAAPKSDRRFTDPAWTENPFHRMALRGYLAWSAAVERLIDRAGGDPRTTQKIRYVASLLVDALSPDNAFVCNPAALKRALETGGGSLVSGFRNLMADLVANNPTPAQVDKSAFAVGRNLAVTPGAVVYGNEVLELIQYTPVTERVGAIPVMMVPPVVNKFYMMDMAPGRSLVEFLVAGGVQVFMISWRNPTSAHGDWGLDRYVSAMLDAVAAVRQISATAAINVFTVCTGAVPLAALLGYIAAKNHRTIHSASMVVSVLDSNRGRSLGLFATPSTIRAAKRRSAARGVLDGAEMGLVFTWMRPRDLVWNYWVNNYLLGHSPPALDILYWNNDPVRLAARMHAQLLDIYAEDSLMRPGGVQVLETPIDLGRIDYDTYVVGGITDHISVWQGVYDTARRFGGDMEFVLHSSGHVQSVVNPPGTPKARFWTNPALPHTAEDWLTGATAHPGSWWEHWRDWLLARSGRLVAAPHILGSDRHPAGERAPGRYVLES